MQNLLRLRTVVLFVLIFSWIAVIRYAPDEQYVWLPVWFAAMFLWPVVWALIVVRRVREKAGKGEIFVLQRGAMPGWRTYLWVLWLLLLVVFAVLGASDILDRYLMMVFGAFFAFLQTHAMIEMFFPDVFRSWLLDEKGIVADQGVDTILRYRLKWVTVRKAWYDEQNALIRLLLYDGSERTYPVRRGQPIREALLKYVPRAYAAGSDQN